MSRGEKIALSLGEKGIELFSFAFYLREEGTKLASPMRKKGLSYQAVKLL
jgi:hypothetical protein